MSSLQGLPGKIQQSVTNFISGGSSVNKSSANDLFDLSDKAKTASIGYFPNPIRPNTSPGFDRNDKIMNGVQLGALLTVGLPFLAVYATGVALFNGVSAAKASIKEARENSLPHLQDKKGKLEEDIKKNTEAIKEAENGLKATNTKLEARNRAEKDVKPADYLNFVAETGTLERKQLSDNIHLINLTEKQEGLKDELSAVSEKLKSLLASKT